MGTFVGQLVFCLQAAFLLGSLSKYENVVQIDPPIQFTINWIKNTFEMDGTVQAGQKQ